MTRSRTLHTAVLLVISSSLALGATEAPATGPETQPIEAKAVKFDGWRLYRESCRQILNGDFGAAYATVQKAAATHASLPNLARVKNWTDGYEQLTDLRNRLHTSEYNAYVKKAKEMAAKAQEFSRSAKHEESLAAQEDSDKGTPAEPMDILDPQKEAVARSKSLDARADDKPVDAEAAWVKAMDNMAAAFWTTDNEDAFRQEPWLNHLATKAADYADQLRRHGEWTEATRIYAELALVFPDNHTYKDMRTRCAAHASLEATYTADSDWKERVEGITPAMANDAFWRIDKFYWRTPDLRKLATSGLDRLIVLADTAGLYKVFPGLKDPDKRLQFVASLRKKNKQLAGDDSVSISDMVSTFNYALQMDRKYVHVPDEVIVAEFVNGAFEELDRFTMMVWPAEVSEFKKHTSAEFNGVGIQISMDKDRIKVFSPLRDTPAYKAGIEAGDIILKINGKTVKGITLDQAVRRITGQVGTSVTLTMERPGVDKPFDVTMKRRQDRRADGDRLDTRRAGMELLYR